MAPTIGVKQISPTHAIVARVSRLVITTCAEATMATTKSIVAVTNSQC